MQKYVKLYKDFFDYDIPEDFVSEVSGLQAVDVNHIIPRGMGGSKEKDFIENLVALTRDEHIKAEHDKDYAKQVQIIHLRFIQIHRPDYEIRFDYRHLIEEL